VGAAKSEYCVEDSWLGGSGLENKRVPKTGTKDTWQLVGSLI